MPNWCNNDVTLRHSNPAVIDRAQAALDRGEFLQEFLPCPQPLLDTTAGTHSDPDEQANLETLEEANLHAYGAKNWYDWCVANWGTKWDVGGSESMTTRVDPNTLQVSFDSAWSPPIKAYEQLCAQGFEIDAYYDESGVGFCGRWTGKGDEVDEDYAEYSDANSKTVRDMVGEELDDYFGLSERMAEWEEEEEA